MTAIEITGPIPVIDMNITAGYNTQQTHRDSWFVPPSSTTLRISVAAIPLSTRTRPKKAPKKTFTKIDFGVLSRSSRIDMRQYINYSLSFHRRVRRKRVSD